ncbi:MAG: hypothetical protein K2P94_05700 [Rhodospirillaceae bacterium]|nr:hypothetical protein [Rhodospirillaceae bacterium]
MLAITHFEVYALQNGRWTLHARYTSADQKEAVLDARTTEAATGFPTKVVRETYFPEINNSETITTYISPKAKEQQRMAQQRRTPLNTARHVAANVTRRARSGFVRSPRLTAAQMFFRIVVAGGMSLIAALLLTGIVNWALSYIGKSGVIITDNARSTVLTYSYVVMFLFFFYALFRSKLPLHRLLADLWQRAAAQTQTGPGPAPAVNGTPPRVRPKHDRAASPETLREWEDLKVKRGDLDSLKPAEIPEASPAAAAPPAPAEPPPVVLPFPPVTEKPAEKTPLEKAAQPVAPPPVLEVEKSAEIKKKEQEKEKQKAAAADAERLKKEKENADESSRGEMNLERMVLRRFALDVVKPAIKSAMPDDPVARRGAAVVLAGGASGVAATAKLGGSAELELLTDALRHVGMNQVSVESFLSQHTQLITAPANLGLLAAGRSALAAYLEGAPDIAATLARALAAWRTPFGQSNLPPAPSASETLPLLDVYMMTELREGPRPDGDETTLDAFHDRAMGAHNNAVRHALAAHGGHEVKHTGKGIFARFTTATAAVDAAMDIQRQFVEGDSKLAIGIIGNSTAGEDPILSANLVRMAQTILARTGGGEILCEARVRAAVQRQRGETDAPAEDAEQLDLVRLVVPGPDFESTSPDQPVVDEPARASHG